MQGVVRGAQPGERGDAVPLQRVHHGLEAAGVQDDAVVVHGVGAHLLGVRVRVGVGGGIGVRVELGLGQGSGWD